MTDYESTLSAATKAGRSAIWLLGVDRMLQWREENLPAIPDCLEAIEVGILLSTATTDAAAQFAFRHGGVSDDANPYTETLAETRRTLESWRDNIKLTRPEYQGATILIQGQSNPLPPCSAGELAEAQGAIDNEIMPLVQSSHTFENADDLVNYAETHMQIRDAVLASTPRCAEVFEGHWLARQLLGDSVAWGAYNMIRYRGDRNPFNAQVVSTTRALRAWLTETQASLDGLDDTSTPAPEERDLPACSTAEISYTLGYALLNHAEVFKTALDVATWDEMDTLVADSIALRDQVWFHLPRCGTALDIGLAIRQTSGDIVTAFILDNVVDEFGDVEYSHRFGDGMEDLDKFTDELLNADEAETASKARGLSYYVTANQGANIRSCASTSCAVVATAQFGAALTVLDDSSDWYEIRLEGGGTGFIAGFLTSKTRPES